MYRTNVWTPRGESGGGGGGGGMNWEIGIDIYTLICIKWITKKNLLYKKRYYVPVSLLTWKDIHNILEKVYSII